MDLEVDGFTPIEIIGRGGTATVYRAREDAFDREVALKVFDLEVGVAEQQRFARELRAVGRLGEVHHAVALVFSTGVTRGNSPFISMRYYPGGSLQAAVKRDGPVDLADALAVAECVGGALDAAHAAGILHRDVKPANVLLDGKQLAVLADFGIAGFVEAAGDTSSSMSMMTPAYAAPERFRDDPATAASDIYSFAATLWSILAGRVPHATTTSDSVATVIHRIIEGDIQPLDRPDVPAHIEPALRRALEHDPARRPASASQLVAELNADRVIMSVPFAAASSSPLAPWSSAAVQAGAQVDDDVTRARRVAEAGPAAIPSTSTDAASTPLTTFAASNGLDEQTIRPSGVPPQPQAEPEVPTPPSSSNARLIFAVAALLLVALVVAGTIALTRGDGADADEVAVKGKSTDRSISNTSVDPTTHSTETTASTASVPETTAPVDGSTVPSALGSGSGAGSAATFTAPRTGGGKTTPTVETGRQSAASRPTTAPTSPPVTPASPPASPPPVPHVATPSDAKATSIACTEGGGAVTFSPGLTTSRSPQTINPVVGNFGVGGCSILPSRTPVDGKFEGFAIAFESLDCVISATRGTGSGHIRWTDGSVSKATVDISLSGDWLTITTGTVTFRIDEGLLAGARGTARLSRVDFEARQWGCSPPVLRGTLYLEPFTLQI